MGAVGYGVGAALSVAGAMQTRKAYAMEAQQNKEQADLAGIEADQKAINRTQQLNEQLSSILAQAAGSGVSITSPSIIRIGKQERKMAEADISSIKLMGDAKRRQYGIASQASKVKGKAGMIAGLGQAASLATKAYTSS